MKKTILKSSYRIKVFNDGSSAYTWQHPWKGWIALTNKDLSLHPMWNSHMKEKINLIKNTHLQKYTKTFK